VVGVFDGVEVAASGAIQLDGGETASGDVKKRLLDVTLRTEQLQVSRCSLAGIPVQTLAVAHFVVLASPGSDAVELQVFGGLAMGAPVAEE
jgi:hypothetical protein